MSDGTCLAAVYFWYLHENHKYLQDSTDDVDEDHRVLHKRIKARVGFIYRDYIPEAYWFELVEMTRKVLLTGAIGIVGTDSMSQILFGAFVALVYFGLVCNLKPLKHDLDNKVMQLSAGFLVLTYMLTLCIMVQNQMEALPGGREAFHDERYRMGVMLTVLTLSAVGAALLSIVLALTDLEAHLATPNTACGRWLRRRHLAKVVPVRAESAEDPDGRGSDDDVGSLVRVAIARLSHPSGSDEPKSMHAVFQDLLVSEFASMRSLCQAELAAKLCDFYAKHNPDKVSAVPDLVRDSCLKGTVGEMLAAMRTKYNAEPPECPPTLRGKQVQASSPPTKASPGPASRTRTNTRSPSGGFDDSSPTTDLQRWKEAWAACDDDASGTLSPVELLNVLRHLRFSDATEERVAKMFAQFDVDNSGCLDFSGTIHRVTSLCACSVLVVV